MRARSLLAVVGVSMAAVLAVPGAVTAQAPGDSVTGIGTMVGPGGGEFTFVLNARSGPSGEDPTGKVVNTTNNLTFPVTCLVVTGNRAVIGLDFDPVSSGFVIVEDNGSPGAGLDTFAATQLIGGSCTNPPPLAFGPFTLTAGDFVVVDAQPFPTSKDQCKNGGWRNYGTAFKNEGQCVSFVATSPKRPL